MKEKEGGSPADFQQKNEKITQPAPPGLPLGRISFSGGDGQPARSIRRYIIIGERRPSHYWWAIILLLGSLGFLFSGISSYYSDTPFLSANSIQLRESLDGSIFPSNSDFLSSFSSQSNLDKGISFFPQGLLMCFYGCLGLFLSAYQWFLIFWNVGGGFNEFNKKEGKLRIFRWGYPGKNRRIDLSYSLKDVEAIKVELKQGGFVDPQRTIYLKLKGKREIPVSGIGEPLTLKEIEKQASELANFLQVSLEGL